MCSINLCFDATIWFPLLIFSSVCCMIIITAFVYIFSHFYCTKFKNEMDDEIRRSVKVFSILSVLCFLFAQIATSLYTFFVKLPDGTMTPHTQSLWGIYNTFHELAYLFSYLLWFDRIRSSFEHSVYELSKSTTYKFYTLLFLYFVTQESNTFIWELFVFSNGKLSWRQFNSLYRICLWLRLSIDFVLNIYFLYLFCSKIYKLTVHRCSVSQSKKFANDQSLRIFESMVKYFLLTMITMISTQIFTVTQIVLSVSIDNVLQSGQYDFYFMAYLVYFVCGNLDAVISIVYIVLTFRFSQKYYQQCCAPMHRFCVNVWTISIEKHNAAVRRSHLINLKVDQEPKIVEVEGSQTSQQAEYGGIEHV